MGYNKLCITVCTRTADYVSCPGLSFKYNHLSCLLTWFNLNPAWITNCMPDKPWDEFTYPFPNFNDAIITNVAWEISDILFGSRCKNHTLDVVKKSTNGRTMHNKFAMSKQIKTLCLILKLQKSLNKCKNLGLLECKINVTLPVHNDCRNHYNREKNFKLPSLSVS